MEQILLRPDLKKTILTGMPLGKAFLINMGTFFSVGTNWFWVDWQNNLLYHGENKYRLQSNKEKQTGFFALSSVEYNLDAMYIKVIDRKGAETLRVVKWDNLIIND